MTPTSTSEGASNPPSLRRALLSQEFSERSQIVDVPGVNKPIVYVACAPNVYKPTQETKGGHPENYWAGRRGRQRPWRRTAVSTHRGKLLTGREVPETDELMVHVTMVLMVLSDRNTPSLREGQTEITQKKFLEMLRMRHASHLVSKRDPVPLRLVQTVQMRHVF